MFLNKIKILFYGFFIINFLYSDELVIKGKTVESNSSMVVTRHYLATEIGNEILMQGGNAVDASVAVSFALTVVLPQAAPIGGGGFMVIHDNELNKNFTIDYRETAPEASFENMFVVDGEVDRDLALESYLSSGVPGTVYGLFIAHQKFGNLPWNKLVEPSIKLARNGFIISETLGITLKKYEQKLGNSKSGREIFFDNDKIKTSGMLLVQEDLANTLDLIARFGAAGFYKGQTAQYIANDMKNNGGLITKKDLLNYKAVFRQPVSFKYKELEIVSMGPPSSGGLMLSLMFNMLEHKELNSNEPHDINNIG